MSGWTYDDYVRGNLTAGQKAAIRDRAQQIHRARCAEPGCTGGGGVHDYAQAEQELAQEENSK